MYVQIEISEDDIKNLVKKKLKDQFPTLSIGNHEIGFTGMVKYKNRSRRKIVKKVFIQIKTYTGLNI